MTPLNAHIPRLETGRLVLRGHQADDFDSFATMLADPRMRYMGGPYDRDQAWQYFTNNIATWCLHGFGVWTVCDQNGVFVGDAGILYPDAYPEPELGWSLMASAEGQGYATEAAGAILRWWWDTSQADTLVSYIHRDNARSRSLAERLGATLDEAAERARGDTHDDTAVYRHWRVQ